MNENWHEVWNRRVAKDPIYDLAHLISLDGYDIGAGRIEADDWQSNVNTIANKIGLMDGQSVFEVGCGAGAFLFALQKKWNVTVSGIDYAEGLIAAASQAMPDGVFRVCEASECSAEPQYDYVIANSVFHYFSIEQAESVFALMLRKARVGVAVLEIPDMKMRPEAEAVRRGAMNEGEYSKKYEGLNHTYFDRNWFLERSKETGFTCITFDGCVPNYMQNRFRFGVILLRKG